MFCGETLFEDLRLEPTRFLKRAFMDDMNGRKRGQGQAGGGDLEWPQYPYFEYLGGNVFPRKPIQSSHFLHLLYTPLGARRKPLSLDSLPPHLNGLGITTETAAYLH